MEGIVSMRNPENPTNDAEHCPFIVRQIYLKDLSLLESGRLREFALSLAGKQLAEAVAVADGRARPALKRARNAPSRSLESMATTVTGDIAVDAVLGLAKLAKARR
jgi:hypothetical protein